MATRLATVLKGLIGILFLKNKIRILNDLKNGAAKLSYSQQCEDLTLQRHLPKKEKGFYVDIGAFHPKLYSNTKLYYDEGWSGINIEPNYDSYLEFKKHRSHDININCGIGLNPGMLRYYKFNAPAVNTFSEDHMLVWKEQPGFEVKEIIEVQVKKLSEVLDEYLPKNQRIDFMNIDVEKFDLQVLQSNDWNKYRPKLILVEECIYALNYLDDSPVILFLKSHDYKFISATGGTLLFEAAL